MNSGYPWKIPWTHLGPSTGKLGTAILDIAFTTAVIIKYNLFLNIPANISLFIPHHYHIVSWPPILTPQLPPEHRHPTRCSFMSSCTRGQRIYYQVRRVKARGQTGPFPFMLFFTHFANVESIMNVNKNCEVRGGGTCERGIMLVARPTWNLENKKKWCGFCEMLSGVCSSRK